MHEIEQKNRPDPAQDIQRDATRTEVFLYAFGNIESAWANQFFRMLNNIMIVAMHISPLLTGFILSVKFVWDAITDPIMAYITDNTRTRWGRRRPYILVGGVCRIALLLLIVGFFPRGTTVRSNAQINVDKQADEAVRMRTVAAEMYLDIRNNVESPIGYPRKLKDLQKAAERFDKVLPVYKQKLEEDAERLRSIAAKPEEAPGASVETEPAGSSAVEQHTTYLEKADRGLRMTADLQFLIDISREQLAGNEPDEEAAARYRSIAADVDGIKTDLAERMKRSDDAKMGFEGRMKEVWHSFKQDRDQRKIVLYVLVALILFTTFTTINGVPYFALGIELSPSYDGRTRVVVYRSLMNKIAGSITPWIPAFCFWIYFSHALQGLMWFAVITAVIGIPSTVLMVVFTRERTHVNIEKTRSLGFWKSAWYTIRNVHFIRIFVLTTMLGLSTQLFQQMNFFLNIYWVTGSAFSGAILGGMVGSLGWALALLTLPLVNWGCRKFQKHQVLRVALLLMAIGSGLKWWVVTPRYPYLQLVLPFFFSIGIASFYTVLGTMLADVTDVDELQTGTRREGMFGAAGSFMGKMVMGFSPVIAGGLLVLSGFDPAMEYDQTPRTIMNMRMMFSFIPAGMTLLCLLLLYKYPLTRQRMAEIKEELARRKRAETGTGVLE